MKRRVAQFLSRLRHQRGHGVHSPYVYKIVREVFMSRDKDSVIASPLYAQLIGMGVWSRDAREIESLRHHCGISRIDIDEQSGAEMVICSESLSNKTIDAITLSARSLGTMIVILSPHKGRLREEMCERVVARHGSTTILRRGYLVVFNNHLPKQHFVL